MLTRKPWYWVTWQILKSAFRHPFSNTTIYPDTGEVIHRPRRRRDA